MLNYCTVEKAERMGDLWHVTLLDEQTQQRFERRSHALVNAAGPWVKQFLNENAHVSSPYGIRLIQGSHIIVPRIHDEPQAYILQNEDKRIVFVIPYLDAYSMIGTTDVEYKGDPRKVAITDAERDYLISIVNKHFMREIARSDIIAEFSGVRHCVMTNRTRHKPLLVTIHCLWINKLMKRHCCPFLAVNSRRIANSAKRR